MKPTFTKRETMVLEELVKAKTNKEIAQALGLAPSTVKTYMSTICAKTQINSRLRLGVWYLDYKKWQKDAREEIKDDVLLQREDKV